MCDGFCLECEYPDCVSDSPPTANVDEFLQLHLDEYELEPSEIVVNVAPTEPQKGLYESMRADLRAWCDEHRVKPRVPADIAILDRAMRENFQGKKLEKALYKVRHRDEYRAQKARNYARKKLARKKRIH